MRVCSVNHYSTAIPNESAWTIPGEPALPKGADGQTLPWPSAGTVELRDLVMTYRPGLEPAIKGLTAKFQPMEKSESIHFFFFPHSSLMSFCRSHTVGVVGRTGSGKSSLMLCLFRMYEAKSGGIWVDGVDISRLGLHTLRKRLAIIPQDPVVFSGTIRNNLVPAIRSHPLPLHSVPDSKWCDDGRTLLASTVSKKSSKCCKQCI